MKAVRIYTGADKKSHFEDLDIPLKPGTYGTLSDLVPSEGVIFRETPAGGALDFSAASLSVAPNSSYKTSRASSTAPLLERSRSRTWITFHTKPAGTCCFAWVRAG